MKARARLRQHDPVKALGVEISDAQDAYADHVKLCAGCKAAMTDPLACCDDGYGILRLIHQLRRRQAALVEAQRAGQATLPGLEL